MQISAHKTESDARAAYRVLQAKYSAVLRTRTPIFRRVDLREKAVWYRITVGSFATHEEASRLCESLRSAGGQCLVPAD